MANNISWMGNKVLDSGTSRPVPRSGSSSMSFQFGSSLMSPRSGSSSMSSQSGSSSMTPQPDASSTPSQPGTSLTSPQPDLPPMPPQQTDTGTQQGPPLSTDRGYIPYYLKSIIGKNVRAEFIIGSNQYMDKTGKLIEVGINYFVLEDFVSHAHIMCDLYSVKFVTTL